MKPSDCFDVKEAEDTHKQLLTKRKKQCEDLQNNMGELSEITN
jgi:hypothetical protein